VRQQCRKFYPDCNESGQICELPARFDTLRERLNRVLSFCGLVLGEDGKLGTSDQVDTISEAQRRASRLRAVLTERHCHPDVLIFCIAELLQDNYFHAVLEATKSVAEKIRTKAGVDKDRAILVDEVFGFGKDKMPRLAFNALSTETERGEQQGIATLMKGMFGTFRNPTAHAPKVEWPMSEQDASDLLSLASFLHRRIDASIKLKDS
jgi:uncharacterized protein (TIGR02391 family)